MPENANIQGFRAAVQVSLRATAVAVLLAVSGITAGCAVGQAAPQDLGEVEVAEDTATRCGTDLGAQCAALLEPFVNARDEVITIVLGEVEDGARSFSGRDHNALVESFRAALESGTDGAIVFADEPTAGAFTLSGSTLRLGRGESAELLIDARLTDAEGEEVWSTQIRTPLKDLTDPA